MPLPKPIRGERQDDFMSRCMSDDRMIDEFTDQIQRSAVCRAQWRKGSKAMEVKDVILSKSCPEPELCVEAKRDDGGDEYGRISGYASVFNNTDLQGDIIRPGAYTKTIKERVMSGKVPLMTRHFAFGGDTTEAIGIIDQAEEKKKGLWISAKLFSDAHSQSAREKVMTAPNAWGMSVGFKTIQSADNRDKSGNVIGKELKELALYEVTLTLVPANPKTDAGAKTVSEIEELRQRVEALESKATVTDEPERTRKAAPVRPSASLRRRLAILKHKR